MYSKDGSFGKVRLATRERPSRQGLFHPSICGWHDCNDQYCIERSNHDVLFFYTVGGQGEMKINGKHFKLSTGSIGYIPRNAAGFYRTPKGGRWEFYWVHPRGQATEKLLETLGGEPMCLPVDGIDRYAREIEEMMRLCPQTAFDTDVRLSMILSHLLHQSILDLSAPAEPQTLAEKAMSYLSLHMSERLSLPQVAESLFVSQAHLGRVFKAEWGMTPHQYLTVCRLRAADKLLSAGTLTVSQIADLTGFCSPSHFVNTYKKYYGTTPARHHSRAK